MAATAIDLQPYASLKDEDYEKRSNPARQIPGDRVVILGHYYQHDVFKYADFSGDSLKLLRQGADSKAGYIVSCGEHSQSRASLVVRSNKRDV